MLVCQTEERRKKVRNANLNGLDYVEVSDDQLTLEVFFLGKAPEDLVEKPGPVRIKHVSITGGRRPGHRAPGEIQVVHVDFDISPDEETDDCMIVKVNKPGDFSTYVLRLVDVNEKGRPTDQPYPGFDSRYSQLAFSFKAGCPSDLDCKSRELCPPVPLNEPDINYLAKDYDSFRQLILDRLALIMPDWKERHEADIGITLVELLAYAGDYLSYHQDAVATEAYLDTARQRTSVRRHIQLVDYQLHEGCNARAWVLVELKGAESVTYNSDEFFLITGYPNASQPGVPLNRDDLRQVPPSDYLVFEPLVEPCGQRLANDADGGKPITFYQAHNELCLYTWGDTDCCLPRGATSATLHDEWAAPAPQAQSQKKHIHAQKQQQPQEERPPEDRPRRLNLKEGDFLLFEEVRGPTTGNNADADPAHRQVVRLTRVTPLVDELYGQNGQPVLEVEWDDTDALKFPLCISTIGPAPECKLLEDVSIARGNIVLADHGRTIEYEPLGLVPIERDETTCLGEGRTSDVSTAPGRFGPVLKYGPITSTESLIADASASMLTDQDPRKALPCIRLRSTPATRDGRSIYRQSDIDDPSELIIQLRVCDQHTARCLVALFSIDLRGLLKNKAKGDPVSDEEAKEVCTELRRLCTDWEPRQSLLDSRAGDAHFVVEIDNDGRAGLRFGTGELGRQPQAGAEFRARYRVGNGPAGNVGAGKICYIVFRNTTVSGITLKPRNPLPVEGGTEPESLAEAKQFAPHAFRRFLRRAITPDDYAQIVERDFGERVQRVSATLRWTGSSYEVLVAVDAFDRFSDELHVDELLGKIRGHLYQYRRIGHYVRVEPARHVPLDIAMTVCVHRDYLPGEVRDELLKLFSNRINPNGSRGYFHADNLSFGEGIRLSRLVATAQAVAGVENVVVTKLERLFEGPAGEVANGILPLGPLEIARLDNDRNFPENGQLDFDMQGGR